MWASSCYQSITITSLVQKNWYTNVHSNEQRWNKILRITRQKIRNEKKTWTCSFEGLSKQKQIMSSLVLTDMNCVMNPVQTWNVSEIDFVNWLALKNQSQRQLCKECILLKWSGYKEISKSTSRSLVKSQCNTKTKSKEKVHKNYISEWQ